MIELIAAGGVLYRQSAGDREVLLIFRNGVWDLPKGKKEEHESEEECACREVAEEVGIPRPHAESYLRQTYHEYEQAGESYGKTTHWYRMHTDANNFSPEAAEGITDVAWVTLAEAKKRVGYKNLRDVLEKFEKSIH